MSDSFVPSTGSRLVRPPVNSGCKNFRRCTRCSEPAVKQTGGNTADKLCRKHLAERRERQAKSRAQPKCQCGKCLPMGKAMCSRCEEREELEKAERALDLDRYVADTIQNDLELLASDMFSGRINIVDAASRVRHLARQLELTK